MRAELPDSIKGKLREILNVDTEATDEVGVTEELNSIFTQTICDKLDFSYNELLTSESIEIQKKEFMEECLSDELLNSGLETLTIFLVSKTQEILRDYDSGTFTSSELINSDTMNKIHKYKKYADMAYQYIANKLSLKTEEEILVEERRVYYDLIGNVVFFMIRYWRDYVAIIFRLMASFSRVNSSLALIPDKVYLDSEELLEEIFGEVREKELGEIYRKARMSG